MTGSAPLTALLVVCAGAAVATAPKTASSKIADTPWPIAAVRAASLGRTYAASNVAWLKTVQVMGSDQLARGGYANLADWIDLVTSLDAGFADAYFTGAILLATDRERAGRIDALLERGERAAPHQHAFPMARGFIAYFGRLDARSAADHYARAASKPRAPPYLGRLAERLRTQDIQCRQMLSDMQQVASTSTKAERQELAKSSGKIMEGCWTGKLTQAAAAYRAQRGSDAASNAVTIDELVNHGLIDKPPQPPPFMCWSLDNGRGRLAPCP